MRHTIITLVLFTFATHISVSQKTLECADNLPTEESEVKKHTGNNKYLLAVLKEHDIILPEDYFDQIDSKGLYKGQELLPEHVKVRRDAEDMGQTGGRTMSSSTIYYLPLKFWIYSDGTNDAATVAEVNDMVQKTTAIYRANGVPIEFYVKCAITFVTHAGFYNLSSSEINDMWALHYDGNAMNVHIVNNAPFSGQASRPGKTLYLSNQRQDPTLAHELGHNLGLRHTHNGSGIFFDNNEQCANCDQEPVSRTMVQPIGCGNFVGSKKCEVNGDQLCDTPGEPNLSATVTPFTCAFDGPNRDTHDNWQVAWQPDTRNVMSYSADQCRTKFTWGQIGVMLDQLQASMFNFKSTTATYTISGPSKVCRGQSYTYTVTNGPTSNPYLWQIPSGWSISGQGSKTVTITIPSSGGGPLDNRIYANLQCGGSIAPKAVTIDDLSVAITGPTQVNNDGFSHYFSAESYSGVSYNWSAPSGWSINSGQGTSGASIAANTSAVPGWVSVSVSPVCSQTIYGSLFVYVNSSGGRFANEKDMLDTIFDELKTQQVSLTIFNLLTGQELLRLESVMIDDTIDLRQIPQGTYLVQYSSESKTGSIKIVKQ